MKLTRNNAHRTAGGTRHSANGSRHSAVGTRHTAVGTSPSTAGNHLTAADLNHALVIELNKLFLELARNDSTDDQTLEIILQKIYSIRRRESLFRESDPRNTLSPRVMQKSC